MSTMYDVGNKAKDVAFALVQRFDADALDHFDDLWNDLAASPDADQVPESRHGGGIEATFDAWSLIIIPLTLAFAKKIIDVSVDSAVEWIKKHRGGSSTPKDTEVAKAAVDAWQAKETAGNIPQKST